MIDSIFPLRECELFRDLADEELSSIAILCSEVVEAEGAKLIREGQNADRLFVVTRGKVALHKRSGTARRAPGDYRGLLLLRPDPRMVCLGAARQVHPVRHGMGTRHAVGHPRVAASEGYRPEPGHGTANHAVPVRDHGAPASAGHSRAHHRKRDPVPGEIAGNKPPHVRVHILTIARPNCHSERSAAESKNLKTLNCVAYHTDTASPANSPLPSAALRP